MKILIIIIIITAIALFLLLIKSKNNQSSKARISTTKHNTPTQQPSISATKSDTPIKSSYLLTHHEKTMFGEIRQAVPECQIFVQVALGAILWTKSQGTRNKFNRLIADFVVTDNDFNILAVIELDDKSHDNKQEQDAKRDAMVREAGYKVLRYRHMPNKQQLRQDILA